MNSKKRAQQILTAKNNSRLDALCSKNSLQKTTALNAILNALKNEEIEEILENGSYKSGTNTHKINQKNVDFLVKEALEKALNEQMQTAAESILLKLELLAPQQILNSFNELVNTITENEEDYKNE